MEQTFNYLFANSNYYMLTGLIATALFFAIVGFKDLSMKLHEGLLYISMALLFFSYHLFLLFNISANSSIANISGNIDLWVWLAALLAPALITLFLLGGMVSFCKSLYRSGLVKIFFGLTLLCYIYMLGQGWAADIKGITALVYSGVWVNLELRTI